MSTFPIANVTKGSIQQASLCKAFFPTFGMNGSVVFSFKKPLLRAYYVFGNIRWKHERDTDEPGRIFNAII